MTFAPTAEQVAARDAFSTGKNLVLEAGAGTGKTSSLVLLAESTGRRGQYTAFNRDVCADSKIRFGEGVHVNTNHSLAWWAVGRPYKARLDEARRVRNGDIARFLRLDALDLPTGVGRETRRLAPGWLAGQVMRAMTRFCQSADPIPDGHHCEYVEGLDLPTPDGRKGWANNIALRHYLSPFLVRAWIDLCQTRGTLRFSADVYLKLWQLSEPKIDADYILLDEAQDTNPVFAAVIDAQDAQVVAVGDRAQAIYAWRGAVDSMTDLLGKEGTLIAYLSLSFRFGPAIAEVANRLLAELGTPLRLRGSESIASSVVTEPLYKPHAILCRTNATAVRRVLLEQAKGRRAALVGDGKEALSFAEGAEQLITQGHTGHRELSCFDSWGTVLAYVANDPLGHELRLMVTLVEEFGTETIRRALGRLPQEADADVIVSTAHKAKGREWPTVALADDFPSPKPGCQPDPAETRLLYVACTRARKVLDVSACPAITETKETSVA